MKKKLLNFCVKSLLFALYIGTLMYLYQNYNEKHWTPRIVLNLPSVVGKNIPQKSPVIRTNIDMPPVRESESDIIAYQVLFDNAPLSEIGLVQDWEKETNATDIYARPSNDENKPRLAILLTDVGLDEKLFAESVIRLPPVVTLSFSPYAMQLPEKIKYVRQKGFENMFDVVIEGEGALNNGGSLAVRDGQNFFEVENIFQRAYFDLDVPFVGFVLRGQVPLDDAVWQQIKDEQINRFGLFLLSSDSFEHADLNKLYAIAVEGALKQAESKAIEKGQFILALPMHPVVIQVVTDWVGIQNHPNISFVPVSALNKQ